MRVHIKTVCSIAPNTYASIATNPPLESILFNQINEDPSKCALHSYSPASEWSNLHRAISFHCQYFTQDRYFCKQHKPCRHYNGTSSKTATGIQQLKKLWTEYISLIEMKHRLIPEIGQQMKKTTWHKMPFHLAHLLPNSKSPTASGYQLSKMLPNKYLKLC